MIKLKELKQAFIIGALMTFLFATYKAAADYTELNSIQADISEQLVRLHIISHDESTLATKEKMQIKTETLEKLRPLLENVEISSEVYEILQANLHLFETENITATIETRYFPFIRYANFRLPEGYYTALVLEIGEANGSNWWCVLFPTLCFLDQEGKLENDYFEEYEVIFRLKIWDLLWQ